jgi:hypothetical protein
VLLLIYVKFDTTILGEIMDAKEPKAEKNKTTEKTIADKIWEEIKDRQVNMFALPNQTVSNYCTFTLVEPNKCYLTYQVPAILPALEAALGNSYKVELAGRFLTVAYATPIV